jgi:predicted unusual protein kinase regulating ubiquinone biosynthesis (AarF/ABC1/UbiB family)
MIFNTLRSAASHRPVLTLTTTSSAAGIGYLGYIEWRSTTSSASNQPLSAIPRDCYDATAIEKYWEARPLSAIRRVINIACELGPVAFEYVYKFHLQPKLLNIATSHHHDESPRRNEAQCASRVVPMSISTEIPDDKHAQERELSQKLRKALTNLGPTFIKVGQQLSIRPDLVSPTVLYELQRLCDAVPPFQCDAAMKLLADELDSKKNGAGNDSNTFNQKETILEVFEEMPQLVASASLGQVYKAKLRSNNSQSEPQYVAIKIQRPDIFQTVTLDLFLLVTYGKTVDKICSFLTKQIPFHEAFLNGFSQGAFMELNYLQEADNQTFFRNELHSRFSGEKRQSAGSTYQGKFGLSFLRARRTSRPDKVIVPKVYLQYSSERVLVTEWINGKPLAQAPPEQIRELIPVGVELFLCQLLDIGKFHADPHPGKYCLIGRTSLLSLLTA